MKNGLYESVIAAELLERHVAALVGREAEHHST